MSSTDTRLDGNAAAGALQPLFTFDVTTASVVCAGCDHQSLVAQLMVYGPQPGFVLRCPSCESVLLRLVQAGDRVWLDLHGIRSLEVNQPQD